MTKKLQQSEETYIQFTPEELNELNIEPGDKFSCKVEGESIVLTKYAKLELDLEDWYREALIHLIKESVEKDISVNEVIEQILKSHLNQSDSHTNG